jgi:hypothetical protein
MTVLWDYAPSAPGDGDSHEAVARGTKARVAVRPGPGAKPKLVVVANDPARHREAVTAVEAACQVWQAEFPGVAAATRDREIQVQIPDELRTGHEDHFAAVVREFVTYYNNPRQVPAWERSNLLAKYHITTEAVELARRKQAG